MRNRAKSGQMALEAVLRLRRIGVDEVRSEIAELGIGERELEPAEMLGVCSRLSSWRDGGVRGIAVVCRRDKGVLGDNGRGIGGDVCASDAGDSNAIIYAGDNR